MPRLSILDLEQRINPSIEFSKLLNFLSNYPYVDDKSFIQFINKKINLIPYCGTSLDFQSYFSDRGIDLYENWTEGILYIFSFYETYKSFINVPADYKNIYRDVSQYQIENYILPFNIRMKNIVTSLLKGLNYQLIYADKVNQYGFKTPLIVKRDTDVDSVLPLVNSDIRIDLLSYLDFRVENNLQAKEDILTRLYKTIIDDGKDVYDAKANPSDFKLKYQNELHSKIKQLYNNTRIRHGGKKMALTDEERHKYYDMCFYLLLQLIRTPKSIEDMDEISKKFNTKQKVNS